MVLSIVARDEVISCATAGKRGLRLLQQNEMHSAGDQTLVGAATFRGSDSLPDTASAPDGSASPIMFLLEELLVMIFDVVVTSESSPSQLRYRRSCLTPPRNLASVSRAWRNVVLACPTLWRHIHFTPVQPIRALKEHLCNSSPIPIHLLVHQWPFRNPAISGPYSIAALTCQLQSILSPLVKGGDTLAPACQRVESIVIDATESGTFPDFVLQTWTERSSKFPTLRDIMVNGNICATWSRACFFDGENAPGLERLELRNLVIAHSINNIHWGVGLSLTTLVWAAPAHKRGSLVVSVSCFHHVVSSFPNLTKLELHGHVVGFEFATVDNLEGNGLMPLTHIRDLRVNGHVFLNASSAFILFYLVPSLKHVAVRGRACCGPPGLRTVTLALQAIVGLPIRFGWPIVLSELETFDLECIDESVCDEWQAWCMEELDLWKLWRETVANLEKDPASRVRMQLTANGTVSEDGRRGRDST